MKRETFFKPFAPKEAPSLSFFVFAIGVFWKLFRTLTTQRHERGHVRKVGLTAIGDPWLRWAGAAGACGIWRVGGCVGRRPACRDVRALSCAVLHRAALLGWNGLSYDAPCCAVPCYTVLECNVLGCGVLHRDVLRWDEACSAALCRVTSCEVVADQHVVLRQRSHRVGVTVPFASCTFPIF